MTPLRFCHVTTFYPPYSFGGDGINVQRLCRALARRGHEVTVVHDSDAFDALHTGPDPTAPADEDGIDVVRLHSPLGRLSPMSTHQVGRPVVHHRQLERLLGDDRFDVVHYHNVSLVGGPGVLGIGDAVKLYTAHEHWLVCPTHVLWRHGREPCTGRQCFRCLAHYRRPPQVWRSTGLLEREARHVDAFIALSAFSRDQHHRFGFAREMELLPCFLPDEPTDDASSNASADRPHDRPYFLFVGRLERMKGLDEVLPLFAGDLDADLLVAGDGSHAAALHDLAAGNPRVRFLGRLAPNDLKRYYAHAVAVVVPSIGFETFGTTILEAFRAGAPVIARRRGPFPEILEAAGSGELFDTSDELLAAMRSLLVDPERRAEHARRGQAALRDRYSEEVVMAQYLEIVRRAAERRGRADVADGLRRSGG